jgi:hypothetical protein
LAHSTECRAIPTDPRHLPQSGWQHYGLLTILQTDYKLSKDSRVEAGVAVQRERPRDRRGQRS